jgi:hypothetical protein
LASQNGHVEVVRILLQKGAAVDIKNSNGKTAQEVATGGCVAVFRDEHNRITHEMQERQRRLAEELEKAHLEKQKQLERECIGREKREAEERERQQLEQQKKIERGNEKQQAEEVERARLEYEKQLEIERERLRVEYQKQIEIERLRLEYQMQLEKERKRFEGLQLEQQKQQKYVKYEGSDHQQRGTRLALLIGNANYKHAGVLSNPVHDVQLISNRLRDIDFNVTLVQDTPTKDEMEDAVDNFAMKLSEAGNSLECCLLYYAGHGMQCQEVNYLIPTNVNITCETDVKRKCLSLSYVVEKLSETSHTNSAQIMIFDACRNDLPMRSWKSVTRSNPPEGLCKIDAPSGSFVIFSTAPGTKALDTCNESKNNSPFALALSRALQSSMELYQLYKKVTADVKRMTNKMQNPYLSSSLDGEFFL